MTGSTSLTREPADLIESRRLHRSFLRFTVRDLTDEQAMRRPTTSALTPARLVEHMAATEAGWMRSPKAWPRRCTATGPRAATRHPICGTTAPLRTSRRSSSDSGRAGRHRISGLMVGDPCWPDGAAVEQGITTSLLPPLRQVTERHLGTVLAVCNTAPCDTAPGDTSDRTSPTAGGRGRPVLRPPVEHVRLTAVPGLVAGRSSTWRCPCPPSRRRGPTGPPSGPSKRPGAAHHRQPRPSNRPPTTNRGSATNTKTPNVVNPSPEAGLSMSDPMP